MSRFTGGPAFPRPGVFDEVEGKMAEDGTYGMSLRDWFAGMALQGMLANGFDGRHIVADAYGHADAMLQERGK